MAEVGIRELLESGVHFGHQTRRWNPKMRRFIHGERGGIYIIDLLKTQALLEQAQQFSSEVAHRGGTVLFVGTKKQARDSIKEVAENAGMPFVNHRWLGGLLTNFQTISLRIKRLHDLERYESEGQLALLPTRERMAAQADLAKLQANLGGVKNMQRPPDAMFVVDLKTEVIAVQEAKRLRIPIIGLVDTNCDPDGIDYVIPGNDDAIKACAIITQAIGDVVSQGYQTFRAEEERARKEAEEQARKEAEARAAREEEERQRKEAEEAAARQAERDAAAAAEAAQAAPAAAAVAPEEATQAAPAAAGDEPAGATPADDPKVTATGGGDRQVAEAEVAEAVAEEGRPAVEGRRPAEAGAAAQAGDEPAMAAAGTGTGPSQQEERREGDTGEQVPQEAGAAQAEGSPASDTAAAPKKKPARKPRAKKAAPKTEEQTQEKA
jgi:small subunit ribosomal protein S2